MPGESSAGPARPRALTPNPGIAEIILPLTPEEGWASLEKFESTSPNARVTLAMTYQVRVIHYGESRLPGPFLFNAGRFGEMIEIPLCLWVLQGEGKTILVDVGANASHAEEQTRRAPDWLQEGCGWTILPENEPARQLESLGITPDRVDLIIFTHLHVDHSLNLPNYPRPELVMARTAWEAVSNPAHPGLASPGAYPPEILEILRNELGRRFRLVEDGEEIVSGVRCYRLGGHSPDLTAVTVETSEGEVVLASDAAISYESLEKDWPTNNYDLVEALRAIQWVRQRGGIVLPGHDWEVFKRHPGGVIG